MHKPEVLIQLTCLLGEGPVWDVANNCLYWVDILPGDIHRYCMANGRHDIFNVGQMVGAVVLREGGGLVAAMQHGFYFIDFDGKALQPIIDPEALLPNNRFNDGKCDAAGRFWAGTMPFNESEPAGSLYMLDASLQVQQKVKGVTISNGLAWNNDNTLMYYIDTPTRQVAAYDFDLATGNITNKRCAVALHEERGYPDGMCIDADGMLWVAYYGGWEVVQYNPHTGEALQRVALPVANVTCCTFGGPAMADLYLTTARKQLSPAELEQQPLAGSVFVIKNIGPNGMPGPNKFKG